MSEAGEQTDEPTRNVLVDTSEDTPQSALEAENKGNDAIPDSINTKEQDKDEAAVTSGDQPPADEHVEVDAGPAKEAALNENERDDHARDDESRAEIERKASEALARRAADMSLESEANREQAQHEKQPELPPRPSHKGLEKGKASKAVEAEYDEKHPPLQEDPNCEQVPEAPQGTNESTGDEIDRIITQFRDGVGGTQEEIMSPRLERQQSVLQLPPRTSSLEHQDKYTISPQPPVTEQIQSPDTYFDPSRTSKPSSISGASLTRAQTDDRSSIHSAHTGSASIFQPPPPSPEPEPAMPFDFHRFLEQLRHRTADPVARFLRSFLQEFGKKQWAVHEQVKIISDFLEFIAKKMSQCEVWRTVSDAEFDNAREGMEKLVMNRLYTQTFSPAIPSPAGSPRKGNKRSAADAASPYGTGRRGQHQEDVERDEVIAQKLRIYGWISEEHLDIRPIGEKGRKFLLLAQQELLKINTYRAPRDKIICVLNCCKVIFGFLKNSKSDQSADAFVPLLIYTVLRARPEHLVSNVQYIWRFRNADKLGGEAGYYMSSLMGVVTFIENLDRTNLTISDEEFEHNVEQAVSAIAEGHKAEEYEQHAHEMAVAAASAPSSRPSTALLSEKSALSRPEVTPRNSMDAERSSPRRNVSQRLSEKTTQPASPDTDDDMDAVTGLLRTIQKPLSSIGRIFSDDGRDSQPSQQASVGGLRPASTPLTGNTPRGLSPAPRLERNASAERSTQERKAQQRPSSDRQRSEQRVNAEDAAARQASAEAAQAQRVRAREERVVVE